MTDRGRCRDCRHANQETEDARDGCWACPWLGRTSPDAPCVVKFADTGEYAFDRYDGANGTWGSSGSACRAAPAGFADRKVILERKPGS